MRVRGLPNTPQRKIGGTEKSERRHYTCESEKKQTSKEMGKTREYSEKYLERKLVERIKAHGGLCLKFASITEAGYPDRLCLMPHGRTLWVELKTTGRKPTKLQELRHQELRERGVAVYVVDDMITLEQAVRDATA